MKEREKKTNKKTKDTIFTNLFKDVIYQRKLYATFFGDEKELKDEDFEIITLENVLVHEAYNDLGLLVKDKLILLVEAQASYNPNMAFRFLLYLAYTYQNYILEKKINIYGSKQIKIPKPRLFLVYTGEREMPDKLKLSNLFKEEDEVDFELSVRVVTEHTVKDGIVKEYIRFCKVYDSYSKGLKTAKEKMEALRNTIAFCKDNKILKDYLKDKEKEVGEFMFTLFTEEEIAEMMKRDAYQDGKENGREEGREEGSIFAKEETARNMKKEGISMQIIARVTGLSKEKIAGL